MTRRQNYQDENSGRTMTVHQHNNVQMEANPSDDEGMSPPAQVRFEYSDDESDDDQTLVSIPREAVGIFSMD
jgi:hypothetical protein